jgi:hypothetical protein
MRTRPREALPERGPAGLDQQVKQRDNQIGRWGALVLGPVGVTAIGAHDTLHAINESIE